MYDTTDWPRPIYEVTSYALYNVYGGFIVHDTLDDFFFHFGDSLREALEYADNIVCAMPGYADRVDHADWTVTATVTDVTLAEAQ